MSARATWKGVLKISLVTIPIKVFPATEASATIAFNQLHASCQGRISQRKWCVHCAREVPSAEIVKGFEFEKDRYVLLSDKDLDQVTPESTKVINLTRVADVAKLDPLYIDRSYYLGPDGAGAGEPFAVVSAALRGQVGIGRLAIYGREYLVAVRPAFEAAGAPLVLHTLHHDAEVRSAPDVVDAIPTKVSLDQVKLAKQLLATFTQPRHMGLPLHGFTDTYQTGLRKVIDAKIAGEEIVVSLPIETPAVLNLKAALEQSLAAVSATKKTPAKASPPAKRKRA